MDFRPLTLAELLDRSFTLYRRHLWLFVGVMAIPSIFGLIVGVTSEYMTWLTRPSALAANDAEDPMKVAVLAMGLLLGFFVVMVVYLVVYMVALGATTIAVSEIYVGREVTIKQVYGRMRAHFGSILWMMLITGFRVGAVAMGGLFLVGVFSALAALATSPVVAPLVILAGMLPVGVLCIYMMLRYALAVPALVLEDLGGGDAVRRSIALTKGHLGRVLVLSVCATVIAWAALAMFQGPFAVGAALAGPESITAFWLSLTGTILGTVASTFTAPMMIVGLALLYYDVRIRKEALDLQLMAAAIDAREAAPEPARA